MTAELINKYISHFKTIWLNGEEINPIPKNAKVTVWCDNGEDEKGFMKNVDGDKMGLNAFIAQSWIEHSELLNLILEDETRTRTDYTDEEQLKYSDEQIEENIKTNGYCCFSCGVKYLTEKQKSEGGVSTFHKSICCVCGKETSVTHIKAYNWLRKPKN